MDRLNDYDGQDEGNRCPEAFEGCAVEGVRDGGDGDAEDGGVEGADEAHY